MMFSQSAANNDLNEDEREGEQAGETVSEGRWEVTERDRERASATRLRAVG